jgi:hypothetical protein
VPSLIATLLSCLIRRQTDVMRACKLPQRQGTPLNYLAFHLYTRYSSTPSTEIDAIGIADELGMPSFHHADAYGDQFKAFIVNTINETFRLSK